MKPIKQTFCFLCRLLFACLKFAHEQRPIFSLGWGTKESTWNQSSFPLYQQHLTKKCPPQWKHPTFTLLHCCIVKYHMQGFATMHSFFFGKFLKKIETNTLLILFLQKCVLKTCILLHDGFTCILENYPGRCEGPQNALCVLGRVLKRF